MERIGSTPEVPGGEISGPFLFRSLEFDFDGCLASPLRGPWKLVRLSLSSSLRNVPAALPGFLERCPWLHFLSTSSVKDIPLAQRGVLGTSCAKNYGGGFTGWLVGILLDRG